ncbi:MAG: ATP-binding protein [Fimbriimonadaceae bacterium]
MRGIVEALQHGGTAAEAVERLFVDGLGWERSDSAIAERGGVRVVSEEGDGEIVALGSERAIELVWRDGGRRYRLPIDRIRPPASSIERLVVLKNVPAVREGRPGVGLSECFDPRAVARGFLFDYRRVFEKYKGSLVAGRRPIGEGDARAILNRFLLRILLGAFLQTKGWMEFRGRRDYLQALYEDWTESPGARTFYQRLALVFFNALDEPRAAAREFLSEQNGFVPYIGGGLFAPEQFEKEFMTKNGTAVLPPELSNDLFAQDGLLTRYAFSVSESAPNESVVAVTPEAMGAVLGAFLTDGDVPVYVDTVADRRACRRVVASHLGAHESLELPTDRATLLTWQEGLRDLHVFDESCGNGTFLVAALEELTDIAARTEVALGIPVDRAKLKRRIASENLRGLDRDELAVQVAQFRLALSLVSSDAGPSELPDLRKVVRRGGALEGAKTKLPKEGPEVEYKASFEWDPRRGAASPEMRHGTLRTIAAFLNSDGGDLYIGVDDKGVPVGMDPGQSEDEFESRLREFMKNALDPLPLGGVALRFEEMQGQVVCVVAVSPQPGVTYLVWKDRHGQGQESVFVRDGNRTIELRGRERDAFVVARKSTML